MDPVMTARFRRIVHSTFVIAVAAGSWAVGLNADDAPVNPCVVASGRTGEKWWADRHRQKLGAAKRGDAKLLFVGDSITQGWEGVGREVWTKLYAPRHALNLGFGGDRTQNVLWRLDRGEIDGIRPAAAVVLIGTNNGADSAENVAGGITAIVRKLQGKYPDINVLLLAILPCSERSGGIREKNAKTSAIVSMLADGKHVFYLDVGGKFLNADGTIRKELMPDAVHPNADGYAVEADAIEPMVRTIMAEPSAAGEKR
jgi:beta-glucosidase